MEVLKPLVSKTLGYGILAGACVTKVPQISNILKAASADGLSATSVEVEMIALITHAGFGYIMGLEFNMYGEAAVLLAQNIFLLWLIYTYSKAPLYRKGLVLSAVAVSIGSITAGVISKQLIALMFEGNKYIVMAARVPQIYQNLKTKATGQLSSVTCAINFLGCAIRIFTTIQQGGGSTMLGTYIISGILHGLLIMQIWMYSSRYTVSKKDKAT